MKHQSVQSEQISPDRATLLHLLTTQDPAECEYFRRAAEQVLLHCRGNRLWLRGLIEFSNRCTANCYYCGIRRDNAALKRYQLDLHEIVATALHCVELGYGSIVLQSGERQDEKFIDLVTQFVREIKAKSRSEKLPDGVGITLSIGEQTEGTYARWKEAGAHRYLLRMETSSRKLFKALHPDEQKYDTRLQCLRRLKKLGFILGTGVMIGLPGQTASDLVDDLFFFEEIGADMIGMGPYIPHEQARLPGNPQFASATERLKLSLKMIVGARLLLRDVNIAASTALEALSPRGREKGLRHGANVIMPQVTPIEVRRLYTLYEGKPFVDGSDEIYREELIRQATSAGRVICWNTWGDPRRRTVS